MKKKVHSFINSEVGGAERMSVLIGEMTFFHWSGMTPFEPEEWDYKFGEYLQLPR